jgi:hypothetical protein
MTKSKRERYTLEFRQEAAPLASVAQTPALEILIHAWIIEGPMEQQHWVSPG